jgi:hypothetical protein
VRCSRSNMPPSSPCYGRCVTSVGSNSLQGGRAAELEEAFGGGGIKGFLLEGVLGALQVGTPQLRLPPVWGHVLCPCGPSWQSELLCS